MTLQELAEYHEKQAIYFAPFGATNALTKFHREAADEIRRSYRALHEVAEEWAGAECGEPVHAQEAYAIALAKRMYSLAAEALTPNVGIERPGTGPLE